MKLFGREFSNPFRFYDVNRLPTIGNSVGSPLDQSVTAIAAQDGATPRAGLYNDEAVTQLIYLLTRMPDPDEVLRAAGITRTKLRVLMTDDEIYQCMDTRRDALVSTPFRLTPGPDTDDFALFAMDQLGPLMTNLACGIWNALPQGYSVIEVVYNEQPEGSPFPIGITSAVEKPFEWFEPKNDGTLRYYPDNGEGGAEGILVDQQFKFFCTQHRPTYWNPYGEALLSRLYWPWFFRHNGWKFWGKFIERFGSPLLVGKSTDPTAMVTALLMAHQQAVIGVGPADSVEVVSPNGAAGQAFDMFETASIRRIEKVILGQTLTSGTDGANKSGGSRALGQVHQQVREDKTDADIAMCVITMQRIVNALAALNGVKTRYVCDFGTDSGLQQDRATRDATLIGSGNIKFTKEYFMNNYELADTDFVVNEDFGLQGTAVDENGDPIVQPPTATESASGAPGTGTAQENQPPSSKGTGKPKVPVKAARIYNRFSNKQRAQYSPEQQDIENLVDNTLREAGSPIAADLIRTAVFAATSPEDLERRLWDLVGLDTLEKKQFQNLLERALFTADVVGYVTASKPNAK